MVSSKLTVDDFFFSFSSDCKKENFPIQIFFFTFGLRYLEDRSGVEIATKMFVVSMFAKKNVDNFLFLLSSERGSRGSLYCFSRYGFAPEFLSPGVHRLDSS